MLWWILDIEVDLGTKIACHILNFDGKNAMFFALGLKLENRRFYLTKKYSRFCSPILNFDGKNAMFFCPRT